MLLLTYSPFCTWTTRGYRNTGSIGLNYRKSWRNGKQVIGPIRNRTIRAKLKFQALYFDFDFLVIAY